MAPHFCPSNPCPICTPLPLPCACPACGHVPTQPPVHVQPWWPPPYMVKPLPDGYLDFDPCTCPPAWWGIYPPPCPVHNPIGGPQTVRPIEVTWSGCAAIPTEAVQ